MRLSNFVLALFIAVLLMTLAFVWPLTSHGQESIFDGTWTITYTDCQGNVTVHQGCKIIEYRDNFFVFVDENRREKVLPLTDTCTSITMERSR